jgi:hypothetical protein
MCLAGAYNDLIDVTYGTVQNPVIEGLLTFSSQILRVGTVCGTHIAIRSTSSSVISSPVRSYSFVVRGDSCAAIVLALNDGPVD